MLWRIACCLATGPQALYDRLTLPAEQCGDDRPRLLCVARHSALLRARRAAALTETHPAPRHRQQQQQSVYSSAAEEAPATPCRPLRSGGSGASGASGAVRCDDPVLLRSDADCRAAAVRGAGRRDDPPPQRALLRPAAAPPPQPHHRQVRGGAPGHTGGEEPSHVTASSARGRFKESGGHLLGMILVDPGRFITEY